MMSALLKELAAGQYSPQLLIQQPSWLLT